jgi:hypothetical protein
MFKESKREYPDEGTVDDADRALERDGQTMQLRGEELEARKRFVETGQVRVGKDAPPILNIRVPHSGHSPSVAGRPFFIVIGLAFSCRAATCTSCNTPSSPPRAPWPCSFPSEKSTPSHDNSLPLRPAARILRRATVAGAGVSEKTSDESVAIARSGSRLIRRAYTHSYGCCHPATAGSSRSAAARALSKRTPAFVTALAH